MKRKYDVFISYRRTSFDAANVIASRLKADGYRVFFDIEAMRSGLFNEQLYSVIDECDDFILVLSPDALTRCHDQEDWVRKEVLHAMEKKKNIIPIMLNGFQWPEKMPDKMENLCMYQAVTSSQDFFDLAIKRLESYLKSRKNTNTRRLVGWVLTIIAALLLLYIVATSIFRLMAVPTCEQMVGQLTSYVAVVDHLVADNEIIKEEWKKSEFSNDYENIRLKMDVVLDNIASYETMYPKLFEFSSWQGFLLSLYGADRTYVSIFDSYVSSLCDDLRKSLDYISHIMNDGVIPSERIYANVYLEIFRHTANSLFFTYVQILNEFPDNTRESYYKIAEKLKWVPDVGFGLKSDEYDILINREFERIDDLTKQMRGVVSENEDLVYEQERQLDSIHSAALEKYNLYIKKNAISRDDELGVNWGKICLVATMLDTAVEFAEEDVRDGFDSGPITPELVLGDMKEMLSDYADLYPQDRPVANSAETFYSDVAQGKRPMAGVIISAFASGKVHDIYKLGDIIISWRGIPVKNLSELKDAYKVRNANEKIIILRLDKGEFKEISIDIPGNEDIVGFSNLMAE